MNKKEALDYIDIAAHDRILERVGHCVGQNYEIESIKADIEYYQAVMKYIKENLK